jgi:hypothetical protein
MLRRRSWAPRRRSPCMGLYAGGPNDIMFLLRERLVARHPNPISQVMVSRARGTWWICFGDPLARR